MHKIILRSLACCMLTAASASDCRACVFFYRIRRIDGPLLRKLEEEEDFGFEARACRPRLRRLFPSRDTRFAPSRSARGSRFLRSERPPTARTRRPLRAGGCTAACRGIIAFGKRSSRNAIDSIAMRSASSPPPVFFFPAPALALQLLRLPTLQWPLANAGDDVSAALAARPSPPPWLLFRSPLRRKLSPPFRFELCRIDDGFRFSLSGESMPRRYSREVIIMSTVEYARAALNIRF